MPRRLHGRSTPTEQPPGIPTEPIRTGREVARIGGRIASRSGSRASSSGRPAS